MEYYIMKKYEDVRNNDTEVEKGFKRFSIKTRRIIYILFATMILGCIEMLVTLIVLPETVWFLVGMFFCIIPVIILLVMDNKDMKLHLDDYVKSYSKKLDLLDKVLKDSFGIDTKEKVIELVEKYKKDVDVREKEEKARNKLILTLFSGFAGILSVSFSNLDIIGLDFNSWIYLVAVMLIFIGGIGLWLYSFKYFDTIKKKYTYMIKDLEDLIFKKY